MENKIHKKKSEQVRNHNEWAFAEKSLIHGMGLFARRDIPCGTLIAEYLGPKIPREVGSRLAEEGNVFVFSLSRKWDIDGSFPYNIARFANHSCNPNAEAIETGGRIFLRAKTTILKGTEITYDYKYTLGGREEEPCLCRASNCTGYIIPGRYRSDRKRSSQR